MITLTNPVAVQEVTGVEVKSIQFEANAERGQHWVDVYCEYGFLDKGLFRAHPIPGSGGSPVVHFRFENGKHPLQHGQMLGRCQKCGAWASAISGACADSQCDGAINPYAAYDELMARLDAVKGSEVMLAAEQHISTTNFPDAGDPRTERPLISGSV